MRRLGWSSALAALSLALAGCDKGLPDPHAPVPPGPLPTPAPKVLASNATLSCDRLVPPAVREGLLKDWTEEPVDAAATRDLPNAPKRCHFVKGTQANQVRLAFDCRRRATDGELERFKKVLLTEHALEVPGLGRGAVKHTAPTGVVQLTAWDGDSPCYLLVTWLGEGSEQATDLARVLLDGVDAAAVLP